MRGDHEPQEMMFSYISPEKRIPKSHPLRPIRQMVDKALEDLWGRFEEMYSHTGRPSIPPEQLLRSLLLQVFYSIRSERLLVEQLEYNLLFRWFVGLPADAKVWNHSTYSKNRDRLIDSDIAEEFLNAVVRQAGEAGLLSDEHFTVDGTLIEAWASLKSFRPKGDKPSGTGRNPDVDFHGKTRKNDTHESTTDPESRLFRKGSGKEARLSFMGHVLMENRHGLVVSSRVTTATGTAEREAAEAMVKDICHGRATLGADKGYDTADFVTKLRRLHIVPHVAQKSVGSGVDGRTTRHEGYAVSQRKRKVVEQVFGWAKTVGQMRKTRHRGKDRVGWDFTFTAAAYNLIRMGNLGIA